MSQSATPTPMSGQAISPSSSSSSLSDHDSDLTSISSVDSSHRTGEPRYIFLPKATLTSIAVATAPLAPGAGQLIVAMCCDVEEQMVLVRERLKVLGVEVLGDEGAFMVLSEGTGGHGNREAGDVACCHQDGEGQRGVGFGFDDKSTSFLNALSTLGLRLIHTLHIHSHLMWVLEKPAVVFPPLNANANLNALSRPPVPIPIPGATTTSEEDGREDPPNPNPYALPTLEDWRALWRAWDTVTLSMIPPEMIHEKPIELRHRCLFYVGHIPTFLDMLLSKTLREPYSEPLYFKDIFERGIDPHVDDPEHCHNHSKVPEADEDWPTLPTILAFRDRVRARLLKIYEDVEMRRRVMTRRLARTVVLCLEHEGFHVETLLYMLIQRAGTGTIPPPGPLPYWYALSRQWSAIPPPTTPFAVLGPTTVSLGHDDQESDDLKDGEMVEYNEGHEFGWDNESPRREVQVGEFRVAWRPVTNGEFKEFWSANGEVSMPASWVKEEDGEIKVRTLYGPVDFEIAQHWPVLTSYDNLNAYAKCKGGRLPTEPELRLFLDTYEVGHAGGANVGFRNWHPVPATTGGDADGGRGSNGGVWEWTSTLFDGHQGLDPTTLFTGYSTDFFDTKHHVVLGASYVTIPRLASRRSVRNFYQHNYPYPWVAARVVYNVD